MEVVGITEADGVGNLGHGHLCGAKQIHSGIDLHGVDVIDRSLADALLKHLGEVVGRDVDHSGKLLYVYLLGVMLVYVADYGTETEHVVVDHTVELILRATVVSEKRGHHMVDICSDGELVADILIRILVVGLLHKSLESRVYGMLLTEYGDLVLGLNVEHIEHLAVEVLEVSLDYRHIKYHTSYRCVIGCGIYSEGH